MGLIVFKDVPLPEVIVTRRTRTESLCGKIESDVETGTVKYFCRSRGHGFVKPDQVFTETAHFGPIYR